MKRISLLSALLCWMIGSSAQAGGLSNLLISYQDASASAVQTEQTQPGTPLRTVAFRRTVTRATAVAPQVAQVAPPAALQFDTSAALRSTNAQCSSGGCDRR